MATDETPSRSDLKLWEQALRNDWPIPPKVKQRLLQVAINLVEPADEEAIPRKIAPTSTPTPTPDDDDRPTPPDPFAEAYTLAEAIDLGVKRDRVKLAALRILGQFSRLNVEQQRLDLIRQRQERLWAQEEAAKAEADGASSIDPAKAEAALKLLNSTDGPDPTHAQP